MVHGKTPPVPAAISGGQRIMELYEFNPDAHGDYAYAQQIYRVVKNVSVPH